MSGISLQSYISKARESVSGEVRIAKGTEDQLVNKGTLGNKIATFFQDIGGAMGLLRPNDTLARRQSDALEGFKESLTKHYGEQVAKEAIHLAGLDERNVTLTGRVMLNTQQYAQGLLQINRDHNTRTYSQFLPPSPGQDATPHFLDVLQAMKPPRDPDALTTDQKVAYHLRLQDNIKSESELGRKELSQEKIEQLAQETLKQVLELDQLGKLDKAEQARDAYAGALSDLLRALGSGEDHATVLNLMVVARDKFNELVAAESTGTMGGDDIARLNEQAMFNAMRDLQVEDPELLRKAQTKALETDSVVRALHSEFRSQSMNGGNNLHQMTLAMQLRRLTDDLVVSMARGLRPVTGSSGNDLELVSDHTSVGQTALQKARGAMAPVLESVRFDLKPGQQFVRDVIANFSENVMIDPNGDPRDPDNLAPKWSTSPDVLDSLRQTVDHHRIQNDMPLDQAITDFRLALKQDLSMPVGLQGKLLSGLKAIEEEARLTDQLGKIDQFKGLKQEDMWRMFAPGRMQDELNLTSWSLEQHNEGSLGGMERAFGEMLRARGQGVPLDGTHLEQLHRIGSEETYNERLSTNYKSSMPDDRKVQEDLRDQALVPPGFRQDPVILTLRLNEETTIEGRQKLRELVGGDESWFNSTQVSGDGLVIDLKGPSDPQQMRDRANQILEQHRRKIDTARTDDDKRLVIAETVQSLYRSHLFQDGNTRTVVFMAMNRMLLDAGLGPAILKDPKAAAGFSVEEFAQEILEGQERFRRQAS